MRLLRPLLPALALAVLALAPVRAQTTLAEGDLAIVAVDPYNVDGVNDQVSFVLFVDVEAGTQVRLSDYDYDGGTDSFTDDGFDGELLVTLNALPAGTVVTVDVGASVVLQDGTQGTVAVSEPGFGLSQFSGDTVLAFQGAGFSSGVANPVGDRDDDLLFFVDAGDAGVTAAPSVLGDDAVTAFSNRTVVYDATPGGANAPSSGTVEELIAAVNDTNNYLAQNANAEPSDLLPAAFTITGGAPTITVSPASSAGAPLAVAEDGTRTVTVTLSAAPASDVTVPLSSSDPGEATVPASVVVAAGTTSQTVTVEGVTDGEVDGDQPVTVTTGAATGDPEFAGIDPADVFLTVTDIDVDLGTELSEGDLAIVALAPVNGGASSPGGNDGEEFSVVLLVDVEDGTVFNVSDYTVSADGTLTEGDFDGIASVTLAALPAGTVVTVNLSAGQLADPTQGTVEIVEGGFILSEFAGDALVAYQGSTTSPAPDDFLYYVELPDGGSVPPDALGPDAVFEPGNLRGFYYDAEGEAMAPTSGSRAELLAAFNEVAYYELPQRVVGEDDADRNPLDFLPDAFEILDGEGSIAVSPLALSVSEEDGTATFTVTLSRSPAADVTVPIASADADELAVSDDALVFEAGTTDLTRTVTVTGVNDNLDDGDQLVAVSVGPAESRDAGYDREDPEDVAVTVTDVGFRDDTVRFAVAQRVVPEDVGAVELTVLAGEPPPTRTDVTVTLLSGDPGAIGGFEQRTLTFGPGLPASQTITLPLADDDVSQGNRTFTFALSVAGDDPDLVLADPSETLLFVVDDERAVTVTVPTVAGTFLLPVPVDGLGPADLGVDGPVFALDPETGTFTEADDDAVFRRGDLVLVTTTGADLDLSGPLGDGVLPAALAVEDGRVLAFVGNPTAEPVALDAVQVDGGTLSDVALVFEGGAFRPVSLGGLPDADDGARRADDLVIAPFAAVVLQVIPADDPADVAVTLDTSAGADGTPISDAGFVPVDGETAVLLDLSGESVGDRLALRFQVGVPALDPFDGFDVRSPLGPTLATFGWPQVETTGELFAAMSGWDLEDGPVTVPLVAEVAGPGSYALSLGAAPGAVGPRPVLVELFDAEAGPTALPLDEPYAFEVAEGESLEGRFAVRVSLGAATATDAGAERELALSVYPNPSAGRATVALTTPTAGDVRVVAYDALGREVLVLHDGPSSGTVEAAIGAGRLEPGVYVVRAVGDGFAETRTLTIVR